jgi:hypothetical protein
LTGELTNLFLYVGGCSVCDLESVGGMAAKGFALQYRAWNSGVARIDASIVAAAAARPM